MKRQKLKGSLMPFIFIILLAFLALLFWRYYSGGNLTGAGQEIADASLMNMLRSEIEASKRFSKMSLAYSSEQALYEHALAGGICSNEKTEGWICNTPSPKDFEDNKKCLENRTLSYINLFVQNYSIDLPVDYELSGFKSLNYQISFSDVLEGNYDEGNYLMSAQGSAMKISAKGSKASEEIKLEENIGKNRYWYLYRNFYDWSNENLYSKEIQECTVSCQGCECIEHAAENALDSLQKKFDEFVACNSKRICCVRGPSRLTGLMKGFSFWDQSDCISGCQIKCGQAISNLTYGLDKSPFEAYKSSAQSDRISDNKLAAVYEFSCTDNKYFVATGEGPKPLTFKVLASASFVDKGAC